eukprot:scaffold23225_cov158-Skeletonema_dohrnii-CCMP3373.AAC.2
MSDDDTNNNGDDSDASSFDEIGACAACNGNGLCSNVVCHLGENVYALERRNKFDTSLTGRDFIDNIMGVLQTDTEHKRLRTEDLSNCVPVWCGGIERPNNHGDNNDDGEDDDDDDNNEDDDGNQGEGPYEFDGAGNVLPGVNDSFEEHRLVVREDQNVLSSLLREANERLPDEDQDQGMAAGDHPTSIFTAGVNDRMRAIEGTRALCKRESLFENASSEIIKERLNSYLQREFPHVHFSVDLLYGLYFEPDNADAAVDALDDEDFKTAYRIFMTQGDDENEYEQYRLANDDEDESSNGSEYEHGDDTNIEVLLANMVDELDILFDEGDEEEGNDSQEDTSGNNRRSRSNDDNEGNTRQRQRRRSSRLSNE